VLDAIVDLAGMYGFTDVATGTNADDVHDPHRPGMRAADERGVHAPLRAVGFTKAEVRAVSREWGLPTWDKPAAPCLASRIAYGIEVTRERLADVERAEAAVRDLLGAVGVRPVDLRVRDLGEQMRVELDPTAAEAVSPAQVASALREAGLPDIPVTLGIYRYGALNGGSARRRDG
jgi:pyridinium-3,5-biscarboxylic acid mononucleotide sulfurtransferase